MQVTFTYDNGATRRGNWTGKELPRPGQEIETPELLFGMRFRVTAVDPKKREIALEEIKT